jgi:hypothetical protein
MFLFFVGKTNADQNPSLLSLFGWELSFNVHYCTMLPIHGISPCHVFGFDQFSSSSAGDLQRPIHIFQFYELSLNSTDSFVHKTVSSVRTITDGSNTSNAANLDSNGMMIPQREETGIYEDHPGLNPTYERDLGEDFERICSELYRLFYLSPDRDLPPSWPIRDFTLFILGDVDTTTSTNVESIPSIGKWRSIILILLMAHIFILILWILCPYYLYKYMSVKLVRIVIF